MAAPKPLVDLMLAEKYGWTPQEIDAIPEKWMAEMMMVLNARLNVNAELKMRSEHLKQKESPQTLGNRPQSRALT